MVNGPTNQTAIPTNPTQMQGIQPRRPTAPTAPTNPFTTPQTPARNQTAAPSFNQTNGLDQVQISQQAVRALTTGPGTAANAPTQPGLARNMNNAQGPTGATYSRPAPRAAQNNVTAEQQPTQPAPPAPPAYTPTQDLAPGQSLNVMA
ncbi:MAG: hypothetical protein AB1656_09990 [Candidatus Omnitrophota bacterium]